MSGRGCAEVPPVRGCGLGRGPSRATERLAVQRLRLCRLPPVGALVAGLHCLVDGLLALILFSADRVVRVWLVVAGVMYPAIILLHYWLLGRPAGFVGASGIGLIRKTGLNDGFFFLWMFAQA